MAETTYDFIIVGSGPAGSALAANLSSKASSFPTEPSPKILLLEAGGPNTDRDLRVDGQRWTTLATEGMNWGYKTTPQPECKNREVDYSRGKGLGGSSAINFGVYSVGSRDDYDEWARRVGDDAFSWREMRERFKRLEDFGNMAAPEDVAGGTDYACPRPGDHGTGGPLKVGYAREWEPDLISTLDVFRTGGWKINKDHNTGDPLGMAVLINSSHHGVRSTASDLLAPKPENLTIVTGAVVTRVILSQDEGEEEEEEEGKTRAIGVETAGSSGTERYYASKEVILCAGALDTPRILMHSGLGPREKLEKYNIPVAHDIPSIGQGLRDHMFTPLVYKRQRDNNNKNDIPKKKPSSYKTRASFYGSPHAMTAALDAWRRDPASSEGWAKYSCELGIGWNKLGDTDTTSKTNTNKIEGTPEYKALPASERAFLEREKVPHYEVITHFPVHWFMPDLFPEQDTNNNDEDRYDYLAVLVFYYNAQSRGEVTLQSSDPAVPLLFNPRFLEHPFDRRLAVAALRETLCVLRQESFTKEYGLRIAGPKSDESDEDLLEYWRETIASSWHMTGTVVMGGSNNSNSTDSGSASGTGSYDATATAAPVDSDFRLRAVRGLRVADMSVVPLLPNCHVQSVAYAVGMTAAEKIIAEYYYPGGSEGSLSSSSENAVVGKSRL